MNRKGQKVKFIFITILIIAGAAFLFFNEYGFIKYLKLQNEVKIIKDKIEEVEGENKALRSEIDSLKREIPAKVEKSAREKYNMIRPGETVIKIVEE